MNQKTTPPSSSSPPSPSPAWPFWLVIVVTTAALVASAILLVDYVRPAPVFCDSEGGCGVMRRTAFAYPLGTPFLPMPLFGIGGFLTIGLAQLLSGARARIAQVALTALAAIVAASLIAVQVGLHTVCPYCAVADGSALVLLGLSVLRYRREWDPPALRLPLAGAVSLVVIGTAVPVIVGMTRKPPPPPVAHHGVPDVIKNEMKATPKGIVTVVDFIDLECPFCRMTNAVLEPVLDEHESKVRVVRKHVPLHMHPHAMDAAEAACCGEKLGKGKEMTDALFTAPVEQLTPEGCEAIAVAHGLELQAFRACVKDPATAARIHDDTALFHAADGHGLPTIWIDSTELIGSQDKATLEKTLDAAIRVSGS